MVASTQHTIVAAPHAFAFVATSAVTQWPDAAACFAVRAATWRVTHTVDAWLLRTPSCSGTSPPTTAVAPGGSLAASLPCCPFRLLAVPPENQKLSLLGVQCSVAVLCCSVAVGAVCCNNSGSDGCRAEGKTQARALSCFLWYSGTCVGKFFSLLVVSSHSCRRQKNTNGKKTPTCACGLVSQ